MRRTLLVLGMLAGATTALAQESTPELAWHDTQGNTQSINQYKGKIILLNFWATWCIPCQHEMPMLEDMQRKYGEKGLIVLGGSVDDASSLSHIQPFAEKDQISFPLLVGTTTERLDARQTSRKGTPPPC